MEDVSSKHTHSASTRTSTQLLVLCSMLSYGWTACPCFIQLIVSWLRLLRIKIWSIYRDKKKITLSSSKRRYSSLSEGASSVDMTAASRSLCGASSAVTKTQTLQEMEQMLVHRVPTWSQYKTRIVNTILKLGIETLQVQEPVFKPAVLKIQFHKPLERFWQTATKSQSSESLKKQSWDNLTWVGLNRSESRRKDSGKYSLRWLTYQFKSSAN